MAEQFEEKLNQGLDGIIEQLSKGNSIENMEKGIFWFGFQQVKEWKSKFGYQFHIYSNDHFINNKPHLHVLKQSENLDCRFYFDGIIIDCVGQNKMDKRAAEALTYFLSKEPNQKLLKELWNQKNPTLKI